MTSYDPNLNNNEGIFTGIDMFNTPPPPAPPAININVNTHIYNMPPPTGGSDMLEFESLGGLSDNEDSVDISNLVSLDSGGLDCCDEELFQSLFPFGDTPNLKDFTSATLPSCNNIFQPIAPPPSLITSACSSVSTSPVPFNHRTTQSAETSPVPFNQACPSAAASPLHFDRFCSSATTSPVPFGQYRSSQSLFVSPGQQRASLLRQHLQQPNMAHSHFVPIKEDDYDDDLGMQTPPQSTAVSPIISAGIKMENTEISEPLALTATTKPQPLASILTNKRLARNNLLSGEPRTKKQKQLAKGTPEYFQKRERNNVAVRRSRDKAKKKAQETQDKVLKLLLKHSY